MNIKDKELAVKIFDHFILNKHKICYWEIYPRYAIDSFDYYFNIDCFICGIQTIDSVTTECCLRFGSSIAAASFTMTNHMSVKNAFISDYRQKALNSFFSSIPDDIKVIIIEECLKRNEALYASSVNDDVNIMLVPVARSLEELAIKMELES